MGFILDFIGADKSRKAQEKAADKSIAASTEASDKSLALQKEMFDRVWGGTQVQRDAGDAATRMMASLMGLSLPANQSQTTNPAVTQSYPTGQAGATASYGGGGRPPQNALEARVAEMGDGNVYDGMTPQNALSTGQYGRADLIGEGPVAQGGSAPTNALNPAQSPTDWLRSTPGYDFNLKEGARARNLAAGNRGLLDSGGAAREMERYGQDYADRIYGDQWNRLAGIAGAGQTAQGQSQQAGQSYANNGSNALQWNASNLSSSYGQKANAASGFWGDMTGKLGSDAIARYVGMAMKGGF